MFMGVKFVFVVQTEELDVEGLKKSFEDYGLTVNDITDDSLKSQIDGHGIPVKLYYLEGSLSQFFTFKLHYHCVSAEDNMYVLFPIAD